MSEIKLPEPEIFVIEHFGHGYSETHIGFTADQMKAAILEERESCAEVCAHPYFGDVGKECAEAIRSQ